MKDFHEDLVEVEDNTMYNGLSDRRLSQIIQKNQIRIRIGELRKRIFGGFHDDLAETRVLQIPPIIRIVRIIQYSEYGLRVFSLKIEDNPSIQIDEEEKKLDENQISHTLSSISPYCQGETRITLQTGRLV